MSSIKTKIRLFPYLDDISMMNKLRIDIDSISFISPREVADKISQIIIDRAIKAGLKPETSVITDATAGVGGNTISFGKYFEFVNAVEIDHRRCNYLKNNIGIYKLNNVAVYCHDYLNILDKMKQDLIFCDFPWGIEYKHKKKLRITLSNVSLENVCLKLTTRAKMIVLKIPLNYDLEYLYEILHQHVKQMYIYKLFKMYILVIENNVL